MIILNESSTDSCLKILVSHFQLCYILNNFSYKASDFVETIANILSKIFEIIRIFIYNLLIIIVNPS